MLDTVEVVKVAYTARQNEALTQNFKTFYKLEDSPSVEKDLFVDKKSYQQYLHKKMRERTPYESDKKFSEMGFDEQNFPFSVVYSRIAFNFPNDRTIRLTEYLDNPNGITKSVELSDSCGENLTFSSYIQAEAEVVTRYLALKEK